MSTERKHPAESVNGSFEFSRYDLLLVAIPVPLLTGFFAGLLGPGPMIEELAAGGLIAILLITYGLFVDAPV